MSTQAPASASRSVHASDIIKSILITGDANQIFVNHGYAHLGPIYVEPREILDRVDPQHFVTRQWPIDQIDAFIHDKGQGYIILEAAAGLGKTTLLAHLARDRGYPHLFCELSPGQMGLEASLRNLAAQLILAYHLDSYRELADRPLHYPTFFYGLFSDAAQKLNPGEKLVIVIDALELAGTMPKTGQPLCLPQHLPLGVFVLISQRPGAPTLQTDAAATPPKRLHFAASNTQNLEDLERYVRKVCATRPLKGRLEAHNVSADDLTTELTERCQGTWVYAGFALAEIEQGLRSPLDLASLPSGLARYYVDYWLAWAENDRWADTYLPLLSMLAAVRRPSTPQELAFWADREATATWCGALPQWRPFVTRVGDRLRSNRFAFAHATLPDLFDGKLEAEGLSDRETDLVNDMRRATLTSLRRLLTDAPNPKVACDAALRLTGTGWPDEGDTPSLKEALRYLHLVGRLVYRREDLEQILDRIISPSLATTDLAPLDRADLLVHQAAFRARLADLFVHQAALQGELGERERQKARAWRIASGESYALAVAVLNELTANEKASPRAARLQAQACLGRANHLRNAGDSLPQARDLYLRGLEECPPEDVVLQANLRKELSWAHALMDAFDAALEEGQRAVNLLGESSQLKEDDPYTWAEAYGQALENVGEVYRERARKQPAGAQVDYAAALRYARDTVRLVDDYIGDSEGLVYAHMNEGDYSWELSRLDGQEEAHLRAAACNAYRAGLHIARRIGLKDMLAEATAKLAERCGEGGAPDITSSAARSAHHHRGELTP